MKTESHREELKRLLHGIRVSEVQSDVRRGEHWTIVATPWNQPATATLDLLLTLHPASESVEFPPDCTIAAVAKESRRGTGREVNPASQLRGGARSGFDASMSRGTRPSERHADSSVNPPSVVVAERVGPKVWLRSLPAGRPLMLTLSENPVIVVECASQDAGSATISDLQGQETFVFSATHAGTGGGATKSLAEAEIRLSDGRLLFITLDKGPDDTLVLRLGTGSSELPDGSRVEILLVGSDSGECLVASALLEEQGNGIRKACCEGIPRAQLLGADGSLLGRFEFRRLPL